ncbi:hypothetical protein PR202_ga27471 [Eleusine coracana subsp. coracana]|uniref:RNase H type-1 domain-containing protein n=1 Tax=Eleusine coracana subsp. coracana TaxID=191504 RepID=A0AAV5DEW1_ELECO|nr:hypothetical protein PR202_ga27471 [Eleusine coracana subsp. coracana]
MQNHCELPVDDDIVNSGPEWLLIMLDYLPANVMANFLMLIWRVCLNACRESRTQMVQGAQRKKVRRVEREWSPQEEGKLKINMDGSFILETREAALGVIIRDQEGQPLLTARRQLFHYKSAEEAEALACLDGVRLAGRWPGCDVILESDCASLVSKLQSVEVDKSLLMVVI